MSAEEQSIRIPEQTIDTEIGFCVAAMERCLRRWRDPATTFSSPSDRYVAYGLQGIGVVELAARPDKTTLIRWMAEYPSKQDMLRLLEQRKDIVPEPHQTLRERTLIAVLGLPPIVIPVEFHENFQDDVMLEICEEMAPISEADRRLGDMCDPEYNRRVQSLLKIQQSFEEELARINKVGETLNASSSTDDLGDSDKPGRRGLKYENYDSYIDWLVATAEAIDLYTKNPAMGWKNAARSAEWPAGDDEAGIKRLEFFP